MAVIIGRVALREDMARVCRYEVASRVPENGSLIDGLDNWHEVYNAYLRANKGNPYGAYASDHPGEFAREYAHAILSLVDPLMQACAFQSAGLPAPYYVKESQNETAKQA